MSDAPSSEDRPGPVAWLLTIGVRGYQLIVSPWIAPRCRFYPSCSAYAVTALRRHGALRGTWLAVRRLLRCNPWNPGGVDHVPARTRNRQTLHRRLHAAGRLLGPGRPGERGDISDSPSAAHAADGHDADGHPTAA